MEKFLTELGNTYWWISVVVVGLLINIISGFCSKYIDKLLANISAKRRDERDQRDAEDQKKIDELRVNDLEKIIQSSYVLYLRLQLVIYLLFAVLYSILILLLYTSDVGTKFPKYTMKLVAVPIFLILFYVIYRAMKYQRKSQRENEILWKARKE